MRANSIRRIAFSSTGSVYGEMAIIPTPEDAPFPIKTSLYAASKLAGEGLNQAYCEGFGFEGYIFRFVCILGVSAQCDDLETIIRSVRHLRRSKKIYASARCVLTQNKLIYFKVEASKVTRVAGKVKICRKESRVLPGALN
jgi:nucleoside-diphosphate-sugar epimerase